MADRASFDVELIWLETTLDHPVVHTAQPPRRTRLPVGAVIGLLIVLGGSVWLANHTNPRGAAEYLQAGWQAYHRGEYRESSIALAAAQSETPNLPGISDLQVAIEVAPAVDAIQLDINSGRIAQAQTRISAVLTRAPNDRRAVRLAIRLRTIRANAKLAQTGAQPSPSGAVLRPTDASPAGATSSKK